MDHMRIFLADIAAAVIFFTIIAMASELAIVKLSLAQTIDARITAIPIMVLTARPYGFYRDWWFKISGADNKNGIAKILIDTGVFISFQLPVYAAILAYVGATWHQILVACGSTVILMIIFARPFGIFLDFVRNLFGVSIPN